MTSMALSRRNYVGRPLKRLEDRRLLRGAGQFVGDLSLPGTLDIAFLRATHAHASFEILAQPAPDPATGVHLVLTAAQLQGRVRDMRNNPGRPASPDIAWPVLARGEVRFAGECLAAVIADDRYLAEDALERFEVAYEPLPAVVDSATATSDHSPLVHAELVGNVYQRMEGAVGEVDRAFAQADVVVERLLRTGRVAGAPLEPRGCLATFDRSRGRLTLWSSTQIPHILRSAVAEFLDLPEASVHVITPDVGGGFGEKAEVYPEEIVTCFAAMQLGRPVRWLEDRQENLLNSGHARDALARVELAASRDGTLLGLRFELLTNAGAYPTLPFGAFLEAATAWSGILGPYKIPAYGYRLAAVATHTAPVGAYRGVGIPLGTAVMELALDELASTLRLDRAELRRRNMIQRQDLPYTNILGTTHDAASHVEALERVLAATDYPRLAEFTNQSVDHLVGIGLCAYAEPTGLGSSRFNKSGLYRIAGYDSARVRLEVDGRVSVALSAPSQGQGHQTAFAQVVADQLGVRPTDVTVDQGDTDLAPYGSGTFASRAMVILGGALLEATQQVRADVLQIAGAMLEVAPSDLELEGGVIRVRGLPERTLALADVARVAYGLSPVRCPLELKAGLEAVVRYDPPRASVANAAHVALVDIDCATGVVKIVRYAAADDCGVAVNPADVEGQVQGGVVQAVGEVLLEEVVYGANGALETASFMDYLLPSACEAPALELLHLETTSESCLTPFKGVGEGGTIGGVAAMVSAVDDALRKRGAAVSRIPMTPGRVREALCSAVPSD